MRVSGYKSAVAAAGATISIAILLSAAATPPQPQSSPAQPPASSQETVLSFDPAQSKVHWIVDSTLHTVHGSFALKSGNVHFDRENGKASGEIIVLATSGESGNSSRDEKMHKEVLQSEKFPEAVFRPTQIEGKVANAGSSDFKVHGTFLLHGSAHEITVPFHAELIGGSWKGTGKLDVPYIQWGLKNPSNFLLKVQPIVNVQLEMAGSFQNAK